MIKIFGTKLFALTHTNFWTKIITFQYSCFQVLAFILFLWFFECCTNFSLPLFSQRLPTRSWISWYLQRKGEGACFQNLPMTPPPPKKNFEALPNSARRRITFVSTWTIFKLGSYSPQRSDYIRTRLTPCPPQIYQSRTPLHEDKFYLL